MQLTEIKQRIIQNSPIPVPPVGLEHLLRSFEDDGMTHQKLAKIISDFPSIAARLLFLANSAWAAPRFPVENLEMACARLGFAMVRSVSISLCIVSPFDAFKRCAAFDIEYFWCASLLTAEGTTLLASGTEANAYNHSSLHTAGLLHNLGLLWLVDNWPDETSKALELAAADDNRLISDSLRELLGIDYCEAGGILGRAWKLPEVLVSAMEQHRHDLYPQSEYLSTVFVGYAAEMVAALRSGLEIRPRFPQRAALDFAPDHLDKVYLRLGDRLTKTRELAAALFSSR